ncbi:hypothetical protein A8L44_07225 [Bacillus sp. FJAT-27986]|nr:hypothetical protein A8L44_07225 [Bacillus sp. FJAT-27986]
MIKVKLFFYYFLGLLVLKTSELIHYTNPHSIAWFILMISFIIIIADKIYELAKLIEPSVKFTFIAVISAIIFSNLVFYIENLLSFFDMK